MSKDETFDVCVIGSGAAGGVMAKELCEGGAKVVMLEAGRGVPLPELLSHKWPYELPFRGFRGEKQAPFYQGDIAKSISYADSDHVSVDRVRALGGRTLHWNAVTLRYAPRDFKEWSLQGIEEDWPLSYEELEPYYDRIEQIIGICGNDDHLEILPAGKNYLPPIPWRCSEHIMKRATNAMGIPLIAVRKAVLTRPYDSGRLAIIAATAWMDATSRRSSARPIACCRKHELPAISLFARMRWRARSWSTAKAWRARSHSSIPRRARNSRSRRRSLWSVAPPWSPPDCCSIHARLNIRRDLPIPTASSGIISTVT